MEDQIANFEPLMEYAAFFVPVTLIAAIIMVVSLWKIFSKAGKPGWAAIVPFYNYYVLLEIVGRPAWWIAFPIATVVLSIIPPIAMIASLAFAVIHIIVAIDLAKVFGKGAGFAVGLVILGIIFFPILAFGKSQYHGTTNPPKEGLSGV